jgi:phosphoglycolate phosphatase-like HAD superfamily hydrolase
MIYLSERARTLQAQLDTVIFDMDGVLVNITNSVRPTLLLAVPAYLREIVGWAAPEKLFTSEIVEMFKNSGGFNDDVDLACAIVLNYLVKSRENGEADAETLNLLPPSLTRFATRLQQKGGGLKNAEDICLEHYDWRDRDVIVRDYNKPKIRQVFREIFGGQHCKELYGFEPEYYKGTGYIDNDTNLLDLTKIPTKQRIGLLTGRTATETTVGLSMCGLDEVIPAEMRVTQDDGYPKPNPTGLAILASKLNCQTAGIYIGDTRDDYRTVRNLNAKETLPPFLSALVLTGPAGKNNRGFFKKTGTDIVAENVNEVLDWINEPSTTTIEPLETLKSV